LEEYETPLSKANVMLKDPLKSSKGAMGYRNLVSWLENSLTMLADVPPFHVLVDVVDYSFGPSTPRKYLRAGA